MDVLWINLCLVASACIYWALSLLILLLRVHEKHFANVARYSARSDTPNKFDDTKRPEEPNCGFLTKMAVTLERSLLCRVHLSRKTTFSAFYITGLAAILFLVLPFASLSFPSPPWFSFLPPLAFALHCAVRLCECRGLHRFRGGAGDRVTLFAALAGLSFYAAAALSSAAALPLPLPLRESAGGAGGAAKGAAGVLFGAHVWLQVVQVRHHAALAKMRAGPRSPYRFPRSLLFAYVMEPHYACEILMYAMNAVSIWVIMASSLAMPTREGEKHSNLSEKSGNLQLLYACCVLAPLGVTVFSFFNLRITAGEHRRFWNRLNATRPKGVTKETVPRWDLFYRIC